MENDSEEFMSFLAGAPRDLYITYIIHISKDLRNSGSAKPRYLGNDKVRDQEDMKRHCQHSTVYERWNL